MSEKPTSSQIRIRPSPAAAPAIWVVRDHEDGQRDKKDAAAAEQVASAPAEKQETAVAEDISADGPLQRTRGRGEVFADEGSATSTIGTSSAQRNSAAHETRSAPHASVECLGRGSSTGTHHLKVLRTAGLVAERSEGTREYLHFPREQLDTLSRAPRIGSARNPPLSSASQQDHGDGLYFGIADGLLMWAFVWRSDDVSSVAVAGSVTVAGTLFGLSMALYYLHVRRKHALPAWSQIRSGQAT